MCAIFIEHLICAHATLSSLCACQIALAVARCAQFEIARSLSQPSRHFVRVRSLLLWRGVLSLRSHAAYRSLLVTLCMSDRSGCGAVLSLRSHAAYRSLLVTLCVSDRSGCGAVLSLRSHAAYRSLLVTLCVSDRSGCGAVLSLRSHAAYRSLLVTLCVSDRSGCGTVSIRHVPCNVSCWIFVGGKSAHRKLPWIFLKQLQKS